MDKTILELESLRYATTCAVEGGTEMADILHEEYRKGDKLALNVAYLLCREAAAPWIEEELSKELGKSKRRRQRAETWIQKHARYDLANWLQLPPRSFGGEEALELAALVLNNSKAIVESNYKAWKKESSDSSGVPEYARIERPKRGPCPPPQGLEDTEPWDIVGGPDAFRARHIIEAYAWFKANDKAKRDKREKKERRRQHLELAEKAFKEFAVELLTLWGLHAQKKILLSRYHQRARDLMPTICRKLLLSRIPR